jgi:hypothetical protein
MLFKKKKKKKGRSEITYGLHTKYSTILLPGVMKSYKKNSHHEGPMEVRLLPGAMKG